MSAKPGLSAIVMAAGKGTRLKSQTPKVLHKLFDRPLLQWVLEGLEGLAAQGCSISRTLVVVGHGKEQVTHTIDVLRERMSALFLQTPVVQEPQLGTGHAVQQVKHQVNGQLSGSVLILSGDVPLLTSQSLANLVAVHTDAQSDLTLMTATLDNPFGYGRVLINEERQTVERIVEEKDATPAEKLVRTVNTGIYCLNWEKISPLLDQLSSDNAQGEFYLTDVVGLAVTQGLKVTPVHLPDPLEMCGINHRLDLSVCHEILNQRTIARLMDNGVTILHPASTMISPHVQVGSDTVIYPGCYLEGNVTIGSGCVIGPNTTLQGEVTIGDDTQVMQSVIKNSHIGSQTTVGPFAHIREQSQLGDQVRLGNFVEVKNTRIADNSNAAHLAYLGDATLGSHVNIGAGTIIANYDPVRKLKHHSHVQDGVKIGCNSVLVSPVTVEENACVAAGSVITQNVNAWDLAIARGKQASIPGWVKKVQPAASSVK